MRSATIGEGVVISRGGTHFKSLTASAALLRQVSFSGLVPVKQRGLPVAFVGAGLPLLPILAGVAKRYAERAFY
ncbi:MAG: hypothetical protein ACRDQZ_14435, partial [Mycobacteriales bacterium]